MSNALILLKFHANFHFAFVAKSAILVTNHSHTLYCITTIVEANGIKTRLMSMVLADNFVEVLKRREY